MRYRQNLLSGWENSITNDDCITRMQCLPSKTIDLVVSDPPYLMKYKTNHRKDKGHKFCHEIKNDDNPDLIQSYLIECHRLLKDDSAAYIFCSPTSIEQFIYFSRFAGFNIKNIIVWVKNNWTAGDLQAAFGRQYEFILLLNKGRKKFNGKRITDVWRFDRVAGKNQLHQNQKPLDLVKRCIEYHSEKGEYVLDGFMGSGTTAVAALQTGRKFIGFELDKEYYNIAKKRIDEEKRKERDMIVRGIA